MDGVGPEPHSPAAAFPPLVGPIAGAPPPPLTRGRSSSGADASSSDNGEEEEEECGEGDYAHPFVRTAFDSSEAESGGEAEDDFEDIIRSSGSAAPLAEGDRPPLADVLPPQYRDVDPKRFFPEFERNQVLRFSRVFGAGREQSLPQIWKNAKSSRKRVAAALKEQMQQEGGGERSHTVGDESATAAANLAGGRPPFRLNIAPDPPAEQCHSDDEERFHRPLDELRKSAYRWVGARVLSTTDGDGGEGDACSSTQGAQGGAERCGGVKPAMWRYGPAQYWFDTAGVPANAQTCHFGVTLRPDSDTGETPRQMADRIDADPRYLPVMTEDWEKDVILDPEEIREQVFAQWASGKVPSCGWIPTANIRTYQMFMYAIKSGNWRSLLMDKNPNMPTQAELDKYPSGPSERHSMFPFDDFDLRHSNWEDEVILDCDNAHKLPTPQVLQIDFDDDPSVFGLPEERADETVEESESAEAGGKKPPQDKKERVKPQELLGAMRCKRDDEPREPLDETTASDGGAIDRLADKDPFNMSNDEYYLPKQATSQTLSSVGASLIRHSTPAQNLQRPFFPTAWTQARLRQFHRPVLKRLKAAGAFAKAGGGRFQPVASLAGHNVAKEIERATERDGAGGEVFFMRDAESLSARDGQLVLFEYSEEHPPLVQQCGMAAKVKNYYKRSAKEAEAEFDFGETAFAHRPPFLGSLAPGETLQALECNLFRAPVYKHAVRPTDFILIRTKKGYFIRRVDVSFCVGQQCPLMEVPSPNSKRASAFMREFINSFIYRLFWASKDTPRRLHMEHVRSALPHMEPVVKKRLKQCADYRRVGSQPHENYWLLKPDFRLPSREEVASLVTPEQCCLHYCMLAAEQRLRDAGYGERALSQPDNPDDDAEDSVTLEDEIKCAPWNTTRAFIGAMRGKWLLDTTGVADPTGCGQAFSYVKESTRAPREERAKDLPPHPKRLVTGTDADLRKLPLKEAKKILRDFGVKDEEMAPLTRWEIIHVIRTLSTERARGSGQYEGMGRFARGNVRFSVAEQRAKFKRWCQHQFELQNSTLGKATAASSDEEGAGDDDDSDMEEMAQNFESIISTGTVTSAKRALVEKRLEDRAEERELRELKQMLADGAHKAQQADGTAQAQQSSSTSATAQQQQQADGAQQKLLRIFRTSKDANGVEQTRAEVVSNQQLIDAYVKIRSTKDEAFIKHFANMDRQWQMERRQFKKLGRPPGSGKLQQAAAAANASTSSTSLAAGPSPSLVAGGGGGGSHRQIVTCTACGASGHIRTNRMCPKYPKEAAPAAAAAGGASGAGTERSAADKGDKSSPALADGSGVSTLPPQRMVSLQGTKLRLNKVLLARAAEAKRKSLSLKLKLPRAAFPSHSDPSAAQRASHGHHGARPGKLPQFRGLRGRPPLGIRGRRGGGLRASVSHDFYYTGPRLSAGGSSQRRRADPRVSFGSVLDDILGELRDQKGADLFSYPVNSKLVPDYPKIVKNPMHLQRIKMKIAENRYETREQFLNDLRLILDNSRLYNGDASEITQSAKRLFEYGTRLIACREKELMVLEKRINPLLDDDDMVVFTHILKRVLDACREVPKSFPFHQPVDTKKVPTYLSRVTRPMDLGTMAGLLEARRYTSAAQFERDVRQIHENSERFNSAASQYTLIAGDIVATAVRELDKERAQLEALERTIAATLQRADQQLDDASLGAGGEPMAALAEEPDDHGGGGSATAAGAAAAAGSEPPEREESTIPYEGGALAEGLFANMKSAANADGADGDGDDKPQTDFSQLCAQLAGGSQQPAGEQPDDGGGAAPAAVAGESVAETLERLGQLNADLELSDSDEESEAKRSRPHDYDNMHML